MIACIVVAIIAYLIGSTNISVAIGKKFAGFDVREKGSKSTGTTNVLRNVGKGAAALTLLFDMLKGIIAVLVGIVASKIVTQTDGALLLQVAGIAAVIRTHISNIFKL